MTAWRLDVALRLRREAEARAAATHASAVSLRRQREDALATALAAPEVAVAVGVAGATSVAALLERDGYRRRLADGIAGARRAVEDACRAEELAGAVHLAARRSTRALETLRDREHDRRRRAWEAAAEDELIDGAASRRRWTRP